MTPLGYYHFTRLQDELDCTCFDCGDHDLNDFLANDARKYQDDLMSVTYAWLDPEDISTIVAFCSLSNDSLHDKGEYKKNAYSRAIANQKRRKEYPSVKLGRLGVSNDYQSQKLGKQIIDFLKGWFVFENKTGCRFLLVDAYNNPRTMSFYTNNGFKLLTDRDANLATRSMYFDLMIYKQAILSQLLANQN